MPTPVAQSVSIVSGSTVPLDAVLAFTARTYGPDAHQASADLYRWYYDANPHRTAGEHAVVAVAGNGEVVGLANRLFMRWNVHGPIVTIPGISDLVTDPAHRQGGLGLRLAMRAVQGLEHAFVNGSNPNSSPLFRGLKYQELTGAYWGRALLAPLRAGWRYGLHRVSGVRPGRPPSFRTKIPAGYNATTTPDDDLLDLLATFLNNAPANVKLHWTTEGLRWRFFHPLGPRHVLLFSTGGAGALTAAMLLSMGTRLGLLTARPIAYRCDDGAFPGLLGAALTLCRANGIDVLSAFTFDAAEVRAMEASGLRRQQQAPATFFYHKRRVEAALFSDALVQGAASDLGLEGMGGKGV